MKSKSSVIRKAVEFVEVNRQQDENGNLLKLDPLEVFEQMEQFNPNQQQLNAIFRYFFHKKAPCLAPAEPHIGQKIYIGTSLHISTGHLDVQGGMGTISEITRDHGYIWIDLKEVPGHGHNYKMLRWEQPRLKKEYGKRKAHPDPDIDTPWIEAGDYVGNQEIGGKKHKDGIYNGPPIW